MIVIIYDITARSSIPLGCKKSSIVLNPLNLGQGWGVEGHGPVPEVPTNAALTFVREQVLGRADPADGTVLSVDRGALPVAQVVVVVGPLDAKLIGTLAARAAVRSIRVDLAAVKLAHGAADQGEQEHSECYETTKINCNLIASLHKTNQIYSYLSF